MSLLIETEESSLDSGPFRLLLLEAINRLAVLTRFLAYLKTSAFICFDVANKNCFGLRVIGLNLVNELLNSFANVFCLVAGAMILMGLVSFVNQGVQVFMVMILGIVITKLFLKVEKEEITRADIVKRTAAIVVCVIGLGLIQFG